MFVLLAGEGPGETKITYFNYFSNIYTSAIRVDKNIGGFEVPMNQLGRMQVEQCFEELTANKSNMGLI